MNPAGYTDAQVRRVLEEKNRRIEEAVKMLDWAGRRYGEDKLRKAVHDAIDVLNGNMRPGVGQPWWRTGLICQE